MGIAGHGKALSGYRTSEKGQWWDESFLGLVMMLTGWSLGRLVELWAGNGPRKEYFTQKDSGLQVMLLATSE